MGERPDDRQLRVLMTRYQRGDPMALENLVRRISPILLRYFTASLYGYNDAEDLLQECWIKVHRARHTYRRSEPLMPWLFAIARHTRLDGYRKRRRLQSRETLVAEIPEHLHARASQPGADGNELETLLAALPDSQREVIVMLKVLGMTLQEVAEATASTVGAVKQKAHRAYLTLRELQKGRGSAS